MTHRRTDRVLFYTILALIFFGVIMVFSSSSAVAETRYRMEMTHFLKWQLIWLAISVPVLMSFKRLNYAKLQTAQWAFGALGLVVFLQVIAVFVDRGTHRWIRFGGAGIQPSELAKPALILFLAYFVSWKGRTINNARYSLAPAGLVLGLLFLSIGIGDLGTALVLALTAGILFFVAGLSWRMVGTAGLLLAVAGTAFVLSKGYRVGRIVGFVDPEFTMLDRIDPGEHVKNYIRQSSNTGDYGYQARQAKIAIGSGGVLGMGLMQSHQKLMFLPEAQTDCIYAIVGEELGLWGATGVLMGFVVILWRGTRLYFVAPDDFGRYLALGVTVAITVQAFINMTMVLDMIPTKGIPLPMISYGGSSLLSTLVSLGMLLSVSEQSE